LYFGPGSASPQLQLNLTILNSEFSNNWANGSGAGMYLSGTNTNLNVYLYNVKVCSNEASQGVGAGLCMIDVAATLDHCQIESNYLQSTVGGGVFAQYYANTNQIYHFINTEIMSNSAEGGAGLRFDNAQFLNLPTSIVENCGIHDNSANTYGGGISVWHFPVQILNTVIATNDAQYDGGGIHMDASDVKLDRVNITDNWKWGISCYGSNITVEDPSIYGNDPTDSSECSDCNWNSAVFDCSDSCLSGRDYCSVCNGDNACLGCNGVPYAGECPSPSANPDSGDSTDKSTTVLIAGVVGGVGGFLVVGAATGLLVLKVKARRKDSPHEDEMQPRKDTGSSVGTANGGQFSSNQSQSPSQSSQNTTVYGSIIEELQLPDQSGVKKISLEEIIEDEELGRGSFGVVFKGMYKNQVVAVKKLLDSLNKTQLSTFSSEAAIMASIPTHKHVVELIGMVTKPPCIVVKYYPGGSLQKLLRNTDIPIAKQTIIQIIRGITEGMAHLARYKVVHRDLAARNILLDHNMEAIVSDFGFARALQEDIDSGQTYTTVGPIRWMALESLTSRTYSEKSDVWSWGVTVWECLTRSVPFSNLDNVNVIMAVTAGQRLPVPTRCSPTFASLVNSCWEADPNNRPTFENILQAVHAEGENILSQ